MWVMKETGGPSSDPPPTGHLRQKVHAQQSTACSKFDSRPAKEQDVTSLRIVGMFCDLTAVAHVAGLYAAPRVGGGGGEGVCSQSGTHCKFTN